MKCPKCSTQNFVILPRGNKKVKWKIQLIISLIFIIPAFICLANQLYVPFISIMIGMLIVGTIVDKIERYYANNYTKCKCMDCDKVWFEK